MTGTNPTRSFPPNAVQKANLIMGAAFVVFTLAVGQARAGTMLLPITILASGAFVAAVFAILAVIPKVTRPGESIENSDNILFFGVFSRLDENEFIERVIDRLESDESAYRTMLRDIYQNGRVLERNTAF
jgi:hypothetical protein